MDKTLYREALGAFMTGVTVVTTFDAEHEPWGVTANSFTSVSLEPPLVLVCLGKKGRTYPTFLASQHFGVNILSVEQQELALHFAGSTENRFAGVDCLGRPGRVPVLPGCSAWFECRVRERFDASDHEIMLGEVLDFGRTDSVPLGYCSKEFVMARPTAQLLEEAS